MGYEFDSIRFEKKKVECKATKFFVSSENVEGRKQNPNFGD